MAEFDPKINKNFSFKTKLFLTSESPNDIINKVRLDFLL